MCTVLYAFITLLPGSMNSWLLGDVLGLFFFFFCSSQDDAFYIYLISSLLLIRDVADEVVLSL